LIALSKRFKAAVSMAGFADLVSLYGVFDARARYDEDLHESLWGMYQPGLFESGQLRMGASPWSDLWRYMRNSPVLFLDRVETPLLIMKGDQDYVSMSQGDEVFTGLYRLGKRARYVRFFGEGHIPNSPANVRRMWSEIYDWFDRYFDQQRTVSLGNRGLATWP